MALMVSGTGETGTAPQSHGRHEALDKVESFMSYKHSIA